MLWAEGQRGSAGRPWADHCYPWPKCMRACVVVFFNAFWPPHCPLHIAFWCAWLTSTLPLCIKQYISLVGVPFCLLTKMIYKLALMLLLVIFFHFTHPQCPQRWIIVQTSKQKNVALWVTVYMAAVFTNKRTYQSASLPAFLCMIASSLRNRFWISFLYHSL